MVTQRSDEMISNARFFAELQQSRGDTVDDRVQEVLAKYGWDRELRLIGDEAFREVIMEMLRGKALRTPLRVRESNHPVHAVEKDRWRAETERLAAQGLCQDMLSDHLIGLETSALAKKLPRESYFVPSLGEYVTREELPVRLAELSELRRLTHEEFRAREEVQDLLRAEVFIFDELIRRGAQHS